MENPSDYFNGWIKTQQQAYSALQNQMQSLYPNTTAASDNPFTSWSKAVFEAFPVGADANLAKDVFSKSLNSNDAMQKLFEMWQPLLNALREKTLDPASFSKFTDPAQTKQLFDKLFGFDPELWAQIQKQATQFAGMIEKNSQPWADATKNPSFNFADYQPDALVKQMEALYAKFGDSTGKLFGMPALGKDREKTEQMNRFIRELLSYASRNLDYQKMMQQTGSDAMQSVVKILAQKSAAGESFDKFDDFFALWIDTNEKAFNKLFFTEAFSQKRNAMTEAGFNTRKLYHEILESQLADLPIARRSEMDEVYKLVYDLRKQVKILNAQVQELNKEQL